MIPTNYACLPSCQCVRASQAYALDFKAGGHGFAPLTALLDCALTHLVMAFKVGKEPPGFVVMLILTMLP